MSKSKDKNGQYNKFLAAVPLYVKCSFFVSVMAELKENKKHKNLIEQFDFYHL